MFGDGPGDGQALFLAARHIGAALGDGALETLRFGLDKLGGLGDSRRRSRARRSSEICGPPNFRLESMVPLNSTPFWGT